MIIIRSVSFIYFFLLLNTYAYSQTNRINLSKIDVGNGLSDNHVNAVYRDGTGFIWLGTNSGLNRCDGYKCRVFANNFNDTTTIGDNYITDIFELPNHKMWIGLGAYYANVFDPLTETFDHNFRRYLKSLSLPQELISSIHKDKNGDYWFLYRSRKLYKYNVNNKKATHFDYKPSNAEGTGITGITEDENGNFWVVYANGFLVHINAQTLHPLKSSTALSQKFGYKRFDFQIFIDSRNTIWSYINGKPTGIYQIDILKKDVVNFNTDSEKNKLLDNLVRKVIEDQNGNIWIGTDHGGINIVNRTGPIKMSYLTHKENDKGSLSYNTIQTLYTDKKGFIWIATGKKGVNFINQHIPQFELFQNDTNDRNSLPYNDINCLQEDKKGNLWMGTNGGGIIYFNRKTKKFTQFLNDVNNPNSLANNVIVSLCLDIDNKLWIGTYLGGLDVFDGKNFKHYRHNASDRNSIADDQIWSIIQDADHSIWIGTLSHGLDHLLPGQNRFAHYISRRGDKTSLKSNYVPVISRDSANRLWIGTSEGVDILNSTRTKNISRNPKNGVNPFRIGSVMDILTDKRGMVWVATKRGLALFIEKSNKFKFFSTLHGIPDNNIIDLTEDRKGNLLVATSNGLSHLTVNIKKDSIYFDVRNFNEYNNLQGKEFSARSGVLLRDGKIAVAGSNGFNIIDLDIVKPDRADPPLAFTSIDIFNNEVNVNEFINQNVSLRKAMPFSTDIELEYNENMFSIEFAALNFSRNNQYAFKLDGYDKNWIYTGTDDHKVTYSNIEPGNYTFRIKTTNNAGGWNNSEKHLNIIIKPPLWKTPLAYFLYFLTIIISIYLFRKFTLDRAKMRFEVELQKKETERILVLDNVKTKFFTNVSHEFRTPLSLILNPLDRIISNTPDPDQKKQLQLVQRNARRLLNLVNQLLDFRKMQVKEFRLQATKADLVRFTKEIFCMFSDVAEMKKIQFSFSSNVESIMMYFDRDKMEKIILNLLSNAFKYTNPNGHITLSLTYKQVVESVNGNIEIRVRDSGIGIPLDKQEQIFEPFFQNDIPANLANPGTGIGLAITKEFVKLHQGTIAVESNVENGTSFIASFPVNEPAVISEDIISEAGPEPVVTIEDSQNLKALPVILLAEDNDDFRFYLKDNLSKDFFVVETTNGQEAWAKLQTLTPDLIVSDVMMPFMDGIELTKRVKSSERLSSIPIIFLTASGDDDMQLESYNLGASDYITKPFTFKILESRLKNIIKQSASGRKKTKVMEVTPTEMNVTPADELFIKQVMAVIEKNIADPDFTVEQLSSDLFLHRAVMYRKLLAITGISPLEFIRRVRLKRGLQLLKNRDMTVSEVAYEVGFNNPKKFSQYFKEEFSLTPTQFLKQLPPENKGHINVFDDH